MTGLSSPFCVFLVESWRMRLFREEIFPEFPFRSSKWLALAFNRDNHGDIRLPQNIWKQLLPALRTITGEQVAFIVSPDTLLDGAVTAKEQPFDVALDDGSVLSHFRDTSKYLPSFFMAGVSERWAVWGDSDLTLLGGEQELMAPIFSAIGDRSALLEMMSRDFGLTGSLEDAPMRAYLEKLVR